MSRLGVRVSICVFKAEGILILKMMLERRWNLFPSTSVEDRSVGKFSGTKLLRSAGLQLTNEQIIGRRRR